MPLFKTSEELKGFFPNRVTFELADLKPTMEMVEEEYLAEQVLGDAIYQELIEQYDAGTLAAPYDKLLPLCQRVSAHLAMLNFTGFANVIVDPGGLMIGGHENSDRKPAAEWRSRDFERAALKHGMAALNMLVKWLFANVNDLQEWQDSEPYKAYARGFLRETRQFNRVINIGSSGYVFLRLLPSIRRIERKQLKAVFCGSPLFDDLLTAINDDSLSTDEETLVELCREAVAHLAFADALVELSLVVDEKGVYTFGSLMGGQTSEGRATAPDARLENRIQFHRKTGNGFLQDLKAELQAQAEVDEEHPYRSTSCYVDPDAEPTPLIDIDGPVGGFF